MDRVIAWSASNQKNWIIDDELVKSLAIERDGRWLVVLFSWQEEPMDVNMTLNRIAAGSAEDAETGTPHAIEDGTIPLELGPYEVKLLWLHDARALGADGGRDRRLELKDDRTSTPLSGEVRTYGPLSGTQVDTNWSRVSGPADERFTDRSAAETQAHFTRPGTYVLRFTASGGGLTAEQEVRVRVVESQ